MAWIYETSRTAPFVVATTEAPSYRRVAVQPPDQVGRRKILEVHTRSIPLDKDVDLEGLARSTPGMVGADRAGTEDLVVLSHKDGTS